VNKGKAPKRPWVLDADLAGAFDRIAHHHILAMIGSFPSRGMIGQWLRAGVVENGRLRRTEEGTPQGGVVSPVLLNIALHGMEQAAGVRYLPQGWIRVDSPALVRYADLSGSLDKSAYAERRVMPSEALDRLWLLGLALKSSA
jgi:RNA-directed DNA polymerase